MLEDLSNIEKYEELFAKLWHEGKRDEALALAHELASKIDAVADYCSEHGEYKQAETFYRLAQQVYQKFLPKHPSYAISLNDLAHLYYTLGRYEAAEPLYLKALAIWQETVGPSHPYFAAGLNNLAELYVAMGDYEEAEPLFQQALDIRREAWGMEHPEVAESLNNLGMLCYRLGRYTEAESLLLQALDLRRKVLGEEHPSYAISLNNLGLVYETKSNYKQAEYFAQQALAVWQKTLGEKHPTFATGLNNLGVLYQSMGRYAQAEDCLQRSLTLRREILGPEHPFVAASLNNIARLYQEIGQYSRAELLYQEALDIYHSSLKEEHFEIAQCLDNLASMAVAQGNYKHAEERYQQALEMTRHTLGPEHPDVARCMNSLAVFYETIGDYERAQDLLVQALDMIRPHYGDEHPFALLSMDNQAALYFTKGDYVRAERLYQQVLEMRRSSLGEEHPDVAQSLNSLARLYRLMGDNAKAQSFYQQALEVTRKAFGEEHRNVAEILNNLAFLYDAQGNFGRAEELLQQALGIWQATLGEDHPDTANTLNNLGTIYYDSGDYARAELFIRRALEMRRKTFGNIHLDVVTSLNNLAALYDAQGNYAEAEPLYQEVLAVQRQMLGNVHPDVAQSLRNLAGLYAATERYTEALALLQQAATIDDLVIGQIFSIGSENQRLVFLSTLQESLDSFLSLVSQHLSQSQTAVQAGLDLLFRRKALSAEALVVQREAIWRGRYPALEPKLDELIRLRAQIAQKLFEGPGPQEGAAYKQSLESWRAEQERLESELAHEIPEMNLAQRLHGIDRQAVARILPQDTMLVEFAYFNGVNFHAIPSKRQAQWQPARYLAFVLNPQEPDSVQLFDLGEANAINTQIAALRAALINRVSLHASNQVSTEQEHAGQPAREAESEHLRHLLPVEIEAIPSGEVWSGCGLRHMIFDPLVPVLRGRKRLFLVPDGDLALLPFEVLPCDDGGYLIDEYQISYLSTSRDVLRFKPPPANQLAPALVVADPDFDLSLDRTPGAEYQEETYVGPADRRSYDFNRYYSSFDRLPATKEEGEKIAALLNVQPLLQGAALDGSLKTCRSPHILHIATHGFFLPDQTLYLQEKHPAWGLSDSADGSHGSRLERFLQQRIENPLLRSGLALAGINTWNRGGKLPDGAEDGLLSAEDVAGMDLSNTEMVVLSACETGLGQVHLGEGVFGLRRAFMLAGARTLVMSLWQVPDLQTQQLMLDFYQRLLAGKSRVSALREAQLTLKKQRLHPYYWGAFICQGNPEPLILR